MTRGAVSCIAWLGDFVDAFDLLNETWPHWKGISGIEKSLRESAGSGDSNKDLPVRASVPDSNVEGGGAVRSVVGKSLDDLLIQRGRKVQVFGERNDTAGHITREVEAKLCRPDALKDVDRKIMAATEKRFFGWCHLVDTMAMATQNYAAALQVEIREAKLDGCVLTVSLKGFELKLKDVR